MSKERVEEITSMVTDESVLDVLVGSEDEIRSMMQEIGLRPLDYRVLDLQASLLELVKYTLTRKGVELRVN